MTADEYNQKVLALLTGIQRDVADIKRTMGNGGAGANGAASNGGDAQEVASERDMDSDRGDPTIRYDPKPRYWTGESYVGYHYSETTPDYLDAMAKYLDASAYMAAKDEDPKKRSGARFKTLDANRARGWSQRLRNGWKPKDEPRAPAGGGPGGTADDFGYGSGGGYDDSDVPF